MLRLRALGLYAVLVVLLGSVGGCVRGDNRVDEEQDPHFQRGRSLSSEQDFKRAADEFEKATESNPRSAAAHFELGWLYDTKLNDYAAAIYHYEKHLQLRPDSERAALVKDRIRGCKQALANTEFPTPGNKDLQKELDRLTAENKSLKQQLDALKTQASAALATAAAAQARADAAQNSSPAPAMTYASASRSAPSLTRANARTHIVQPHETISSIAAQCGIRASALLAANPRTNPRRLRVGQSLVLP